MQRREERQRRQKGTLACLLLAASCSPVDFITEHGLRVFVNDTPETQERIEAATALVVKHVAGNVLAGEEAVLAVIDGVVVNVESEMFSCGWAYPEGMRCAGLAGYYAIKYLYFECIADSAFTHELIHIIGQRALHEWDYEHSNDDFWGHEAIDLLVSKEAHTVLCEREHDRPN